MSGNDSDNDMRDQQSDDADRAEAGLSGSGIIPEDPWSDL